MRPAPPGNNGANSRVTAHPGVCAALLGSALIHSTVMGDHLTEWLPAGLFFLGLVGVETALALAALYAWGRRSAQAVVLAGLAPVAVWLVSRTVGLPVGPADFRVPEAVGVPDVASCLLELGAAALAWRTAASRWTPRTATGRGVVPSPRGWVTTGVTVLALGVTAWGIQPALDRTGDHAGHGRHGTA